MPRLILNDDMVDARGQGVDVFPEHVTGFEKFLMRALGVGESVAKKIAADYLPPGTCYAHAATGKAIFRKFLPDSPINPHLVEGVCCALELFKPSLPWCKICGDLALGQDPTTRVWRKVHVGMKCPSCRWTIDWSPPVVWHFNWVRETWDSVSVTHDESTGKSVRIHRDLIAQILNDLGGLHPDIQEVLDTKEIQLPMLLAGLWQENPHRYANDHQCVIWAVSKRYYGSTYVLNPEILECAVRYARDYLPPVWEPTIQAREPVVARDLSVPHRRSDSVVVLYPSGDYVPSVSSIRELCLHEEFRMHLLPLCHANGILVRERDYLDAPERDLHREIEQAKLVICLTSPYFLDEARVGGTFLARAVACMGSIRNYQAKIVVVRLQHYAGLTQGHFLHTDNGIEHMSLPTCTSRDVQWAQIVDTIRRRLSLPDAQYGLTPQMVPEKLVLAAYAKLLRLTEHQFRRVLDQINVKDLHAIRSQERREEALVHYCLHHNAFLRLREALENVL